MNEIPSNELVESVRNLEHQVRALNKRFRAMCMICFGLLVITILGRSGFSELAFASAEPETEQKIRARAFELLDSKDRVVASLSCGKRGESAALMFTDQEGLPRASIGYAQNGISTMSLFDAKGRIRLGQLIDDKGQPATFMYNEQNKAQFMMGMATGEPVLSIGDSRGEARIVLAARGNALPVINLNNDKGMSLIDIALAKEDEPLVTVVSGKGQGIANMNVVDGIPSFRIGNKADNVIYSLQLTKDAKPVFQDSNGKPVDLTS